MAGKSKDHKDKNRTGKMTPYDAKVAGTFSEKPRKKKSPPRKPTPEENRANNRAAYDVAHEMSQVRRLIPLFKQDLEAMNKGKVGRPYLYPNAMVMWMMGLLSGFDGGLRAISGFCEGMLEPYGLHAPSPSRLMERANELSETHSLEVPKELRERYGDHIYALYVNPDVTDRVRRVGVDGSGLALENANRWRLKKWRKGPKHKGWMHFHVLCDVDSGEILAFILADETVGDAPQLTHLVDEAIRVGHRISTVYADNAYCSDDIWIHLCNDHGLRFVTCFKVNTAPRNNGCAARGEAAQEWCNMPYDEWLEASGYGTRWKCECVFSDFKRIFPETITSRTREGICRQVIFRTVYFNRYKKTRAHIMGVTGNGVVLA